MHETKTLGGCRTGTRADSCCMQLRVGRMKSQWIKMANCAACHTQRTRVCKVGDCGVCACIPPHKSQRVVQGAPSLRNFQPLAHSMIRTNLISIRPDPGLSFGSEYAHSFVEKDGTLCARETTRCKAEEEIPTHQPLMAAVGCR